MAKHPYTLSKSQYCKGIKCQKNIWLYRFERALATPPSEFQTLLFRQGHEVGRLAQEYFGGGVLIDEDFTQPDKAIEHTAAALNARADYIFEAAFQFEDCLVRVDILRRNSDGTHDLIEVKSTNSVKRHHLDDIAIQKFVTENCGISINDFFLMHLNREYKRDSELDVKQMFILQRVNGDLEQPFERVPQKLNEIRAALANQSQPESQLGSHCNSPYECEFKKHCWQDVGTTSIHNLPRISDKKTLKLINSNIANMEDVPDDFALTETQLAHVSAAKLKKPVADMEAITDSLKSITYPIYFLDFESVSYAIPRFNGDSPYKQIPFQYSLHIQRNPSGNLEHKEYLHTESSDPRPFLIERLSNDIKIDNGSIVVYHQQFERGVLADLAKLYPRYQKAMEDMIGRLWDLELPFSKRHYCDAAFGGSSSIKAILPVVSPEFSYSDLEIKSGDLAAKMYMDIVDGSQSKQRAINALKKYCERDTIAMVEILKFLFQLTNREAA